MTTWGLKKCIERYMGKEYVDKIWKEIGSKTTFDKEN